jgi:hypothetical protein
MAVEMTRCGNRGKPNGRLSTVPTNTWKTQRRRFHGITPRHNFGTPPGKAGDWCSGGSLPEKPPSPPEAGLAPASTPQLLSLETRLRASAARRLTSWSSFSPSKSRSRPWPRSDSYCGALQLSQSLRRKACCDSQSAKPQIVNSLALAWFDPFLDVASTVG